MKIFFKVLIIGLISSNYVFAQDFITEAKENELDKAKKTITARNVSGNTYIITGEGGNIGFHVSENGILMVDNQFDDSTEKILEEVKKISDKPITYLINTHHHGDHTGGNENMAALGTKIIAHENVRNNMVKRKGDGIPYSAVPVITFSENMKLYFDSQEIFAFHVSNAHTNGDVVIYFPQTNVMHTGDAFVNKTYPFIDIESGGTLEGYMEGLDKMLMIINKTTQIIPGHGPLGTTLDIIATKNMLDAISTKVKIEISKGKTEEEIVANEDITKYYDDQGYGNGFINSEKIRRTIYNEIVEGFDEKQKKLMELQKINSKRKQEDKKN
ncbi:MBL fold metallo-hydrolase [Jejudonia soesokkakensis]|uniref:beta-lactamase n=1 Tax=Jejudonia soesokkakensis TaxID=1323432 RepID=A0ABW2MWR2_9FLAO